MNRACLASLLLLFPACAEQPDPPVESAWDKYVYSAALGPPPAPGTLNNCDANINDCPVGSHEHHGFHSHR